MNKFSKTVLASALLAGSMATQADMFIIKPVGESGCRKLPSHSIKEEIAFARNVFGSDLHVVADTFYNEKFESWMAFIRVGEVGSGNGAVFVKGDFEQCQKFAIAIVAGKLRADIASRQ